MMNVLQKWSKIVKIVHGDKETEANNDDTNIMANTSCRRNIYKYK